jgi:hypothetical protein
MWLSRSWPEGYPTGPRGLASACPEYRDNLVHLVLGEMVAMALPSAPALPSQMVGLGEMAHHVIAAPR